MYMYLTYLGSSAYSHDLVSHNNQSCVDNPIDSGYHESTLTSFKSALKNKQISCFKIVILETKDHNTPATVILDVSAENPLKKKVIINQAAFDAQAAKKTVKKKNYLGDMSPFYAASAGGSMLQSLMEGNTISLSQSEELLG